VHKADEVAFKLEVCQKTTGSMGERVQTSPSNITEMHYADYIDANRKLQDLVKEYNEARDEVTAFLYGNLDFIDADLLEWRYINDKTLKDTAELVGIAYQTARSRMSKAERIERAKFCETDTQINSNEQ
jgi:ribosomal protein L33